MKKLFAGIFCASLFPGLLSAAVEFDRGGVTFPMEKISAERFANTGPQKKKSPEQRGSFRPRSNTGRRQLVEHGLDF
jgi:hypothetical protein